MINVLLTGASGYLGGDLFDYLQTESVLPPHGTIYALVRSEEQAKQVQKLYGATPLMIDLSDEQAVVAALLEKQISIVFSLIDAFKVDMQLKFLHGLAVVSKKFEVQSHFLHTAGAKIFSNWAGMPTDRVLSDAGADLYSLQKSTKPVIPLLQIAVNTNNTVIEEGERLGVKTYIFAPCIVYGTGAGFGNRVSIQTKAVIKVARTLRKVYRPDKLNGTWPVSQVRDNSSLYAQLLSNMLANEDIPHGRNGYYLASSGSVAWNDIYACVAQSLARRSVVDSDQVEDVTQASLEQAANALQCPVEMVPFQTGGKCTLQADNGLKIGWKPSFAAEHILEALDDECELVLQHS